MQTCTVTNFNYQLMIPFHGIMHSVSAPSCSVPWCLLLFIYTDYLPTPALGPRCFDFFPDLYVGKKVQWPSYIPETYEGETYLRTSFSLRGLESSAICAENSNVYQQRKRIQNKQYGRQERRNENRIVYPVG